MRIRSTTKTFPGTAASTSIASESKSLRHKNGIGRLSGKTEISFLCFLGLGDLDTSTIATSYVDDIVSDSNQESGTYPTRFLVLG